jgi:hypothetical protein
MECILFHRLRNYHQNPSFSRVLHSYLTLNDMQMILVVLSRYSAIHIEIVEALMVYSY